MLLGAGRQPQSQGVAHRGFGGKRRGQRAGDNGGEVRQAAVQGDERGEFRRRAFTDRRGDVQPQAVQFAGHDPGARRGPGRALRVQDVQQLGAVGQEGQHLLVQAVGQGVAAKAVRVGQHREVDEAVGQRRGHVEHRGAVFLAVARRPHQPAVGDAVGADAAVENQLLGDALHRRRGHVDLVEKQDAGAGGGEEFRRIPAAGAGVRVGDRQAAQVGGGELAEAHVDQVDPDRLRHLGDDAGFADARRPPDHGAQKQPGFRQAGEEGGELRGRELHEALRVRPPGRTPPTWPAPPRAPRALPSSASLARVAGGVAGWMAMAARSSHQVERKYLASAGTGVQGLSSASRRAREGTAAAVNCVAS